MKRHIIKAFVFTGLLISCNTTDKKIEERHETAETDIVEDTAVTSTIQLTPIDTDEALIATALMAAPEASRAGCKVIGYNMAGEFVTLKEGNNEFIVLADNPKKKGFSAPLRINNKMTEHESYLTYFLNNFNNGQ